MEKVSSAKSITFLGMHLKSNLDQDGKINAIVRKCENHIKITNPAKHILWGANLVILVKVYDTHEVKYGIWSIFTP
jgi:hypothetical protein